MWFVETTRVSVSNILIVTDAASTDRIDSQILRDRSGLSLESPNPNKTVHDCLHIACRLVSNWSVMREVQNDYV